MSTQSLISLGLALSAFLGVLAIGLRVKPADLRCLFGRPSQLARSLLAMFVLAPLIAVVVCKLFSLHPAVIVGLVTLSVAPVGAMFSKAMLPLVAPDNPAYARGLFFASTVLSVLLTPLAVEVIQRLFGEGRIVHVSPLVVAKVVMGSALLPLGLGLAIGRWRPETRVWIPAVQKLSALVLLACAVPIVVGAWPVMASIVREGTLTAVALMTLVGLAAGHFLGGPAGDDRTVLAFATVSRHPGVAAVLAALTDQPLAPVGVLLAVLVSELAVVPYKLWRKRLRAAAMAATGRGLPPTGAH